MPDSASLRKRLVEQRFDGDGIVLALQDRQIAAGAEIRLSMTARKPSRRSRWSRTSMEPATTAISPPRLDRKRP